MTSIQFVAKRILRDVIIVAAGLVVIWLVLWAALGTTNPFYVVASGSMVPELMVHDILIVQGHIPFEELGLGDIIVFNRPSDHSRVIVHRVVSITDEDPRTIRTKGDANAASIPGTDFPIMAGDYIGKVIYVVPQIGYATQALKPPVNYVIIAIIVGYVVLKQMTKGKDPKGDGAKSSPDPDSIGDNPEYGAAEPHTLPDEDAPVKPADDPENLPSTDISSEPKPSKPERPADHEQPSKEIPQEQRDQSDLAGSSSDDKRTE